VGLGSPVEIFRFVLLPTQQLVTRGPYAYTRNPMFLGVLFLLLAIALHGMSITALALLPILLLVGLEYIRVYEEPALRERFGEEYRQYRRSVPALIPRFRR
jgi:protein-S-isoprenylcysteine O-methyltransferase Ste14